MANRWLTNFGKRGGLDTWLFAIGLPVLFLILAVTTPGQLEQMPPLCVWSRLLGGPCPGCGTTRALCCVLHGEFARAIDYNRNVVVVAPLLLGLWLGSLRTLLRARRAPLDSNRSHRHQ